jgi:hypothetical protein
LSSRKHDVEARPVLLDEIEFEQQRFGIRIRDRDFHARGLRHQRLNLGLYVARLKVRADAALQIACLADVEDLAVCIQHAVYAGPAGRLSTNDFGVEWRGCDAHSGRSASSEARALWR